jgi:hypothetical protein
MSRRTSSWILAASLSLAVLSTACGRSATEPSDAPVVMLEGQGSDNLEGQGSDN